VAAGALILAAGYSHRFGSDKRSFVMPDGRSLLAATLAPYLESFANVAVVVRDSDSTIAQQLASLGSRRKPIIIPTARASDGMAASLGDGVRALADWEYVFIGLGDMPFVRAETLRMLDATMRSSLCGANSGVIVQPRCNDQRGHPVGFSSHFFSELMSLEGDRGAQAVIAAHAGVLVELPTDDRGVLEDVDQPPD